MNSRFPGATTCPREQKESNIWDFYRFQEEDAAGGTSFAPSDPSRRTRQFPFSETKHSTINTGTKSAPAQPKERDPTTRLPPSFSRPVSLK